MPNIQVIKKFQSMQNVNTTIFQWKMTSEEALAYRLGLIFIQKCHELLPDYVHTKYPKKGDPRKSFLFKICYKLQKETKGIIDPEDYERYIHAQLYILKRIEDSKGIHALISPSCLVGDGAWKRWKVFEKQFNKAKKQIEVTELEAGEGSIDHCRLDLIRTRKFLDKRFPEGHTIQDIEQLFATGEIDSLVGRKFISPYFVILSPWTLLNKKIDLSVIRIDLEPYKKLRSVKMLTIFRAIFPEHFGEKAT